MRRPNLPLSIGIAGLLTVQVACTDTPTGPELTGAVQPLEYPEYLDVYVHNATQGRVAVSLESGGAGIALWSIEGRQVRHFQVTKRAFLGGGPMRFVATAIETGESRTSEMLVVQVGWVVEVLVSDSGVIASVHSGGPDDSREGVKPHIPYE